MKTNGARILESLGIPFDFASTRSIRTICPPSPSPRKIGMPPEQVFKTLLTTGGPTSYVFAVIPGDAELDFKKLARAAGLRKAEMVPLKDVQPLTGYIRGGVTVFGAKKPYPVFVDETAILFDKISVSAGTRGTQIHPFARRLSARRRGPDRRPDQIHLHCGGTHSPMTRALWTHLVKGSAHRVALAGRPRLHALFLRCWWSCSSRLPLTRAAPFPSRSPAACSAWPPCSPRSARSTRPGRARFATR